MARRLLRCAHRNSVARRLIDRRADRGYAAMYRGARYASARHGVCSLAARRPRGACYGVVVGERRRERFAYDDARRRPACAKQSHDVCVRRLAPAVALEARPCLVRCRPHARRLRGELGVLATSGLRGLAHRLELLWREEEALRHLLSRMRSCSTGTKKRRTFAGEKRSAALAFRFTVTDPAPAPAFTELVRAGALSTWPPSAK